jgi:hypothetical protein
MLGKGAIEIVPPTEMANENAFYHQLFLVEKRKAHDEAPQEFRPCSNLKPLNRHLQCPHFKMEDTRTLMAMLRKGDHATSCDLKDAYFGVPIEPRYRDYLRFRWRGKHYRFKSMNFGLSISPRCFTKLWRPVIALLRSWGIRCLVYIDDWYCLGKDARECAQHSAILMTVLQSLGAILKPAKCDLKPSPVFECLGKIFNTTDMTVSLPQRKLKEIKKLARRLRNAKTTVKARPLASFLGKIAAANDAFLLARRRTTNLRHQLQKAIGFSHDYSATVLLTKECRLDLAFWSDNLAQWNGNSFIPIAHKHQVDIYSDACLDLGWGGWMKWQEQLRQTRGFFSTEEQPFSNNVKESWGQLWTVQALVTHYIDPVYWDGLALNLWCDNSTWVSYCKKQGGRFDHLTVISHELWDWCTKRGIRIYVNHIPGKLNVRADKLSRWFNDRRDWSLNRKVAKRLFLEWGIPDMDLMATRINAQVSTFASFFPDPDAVFTDAFSRPWAPLGRLLYVNPPFNQIGKIIQHLSYAEHTQTELILLTPFWVSQPWWPTVVASATDWPIVLPHDIDLMVPPRAGLQRWKPPWLTIAWRISSSALDAKAWRKTQSHLFLGDTSTTRKRMLRFGNNSPSGQQLNDCVSTILSGLAQCL